jgi:hypothetical protein
VVVEEVPAQPVPPGVVVGAQADSDIFLQSQLTLLRPIRSLWVLAAMDLFQPTYQYQLLAAIPLLSVILPTVADTVVPTLPVWTRVVLVVQAAVVREIVLLRGLP